MTLRDSVVLPMLKDKSLLGVFFGDELCWQCLSWQNLSTAVETVRADLPFGEAILYYNEAFPVFVGNKCSTGGDFDPNRTNFSYPHVPTALDWVSLDYYPDEGTLLGVSKLYEQHVYPKMGPHQKALFVPPAYGCNSTKCSNQLCCSNSTRDGANVPCNGDCTVAMLQWAKGIYDWARSDPRIGRLRQTHHTHTLYSYTLHIHPTYTLIRPTHTALMLCSYRTRAVCCAHPVLTLCIGTHTGYCTRTP